VVSFCGGGGAGDRSSMSVVMSESEGPALVTGEPDPSYGRDGGSGEVVRTRVDQARKKTRRKD